MNSPKCFPRGRHFVFGLAVLWLAGNFAPAQDADRFRPYLRFHSGDVEPLWGVDDHWSFGLGADLNRLWGGELSLDFFERDFKVGSIGTVCEVAAWNWIPEIRLRHALLNRRLVPYLIAGLGPSFLQANDRKPRAFGRTVDIEGWTFAAAVGGGLEYFFADNLTFGVEARYLYVDPIDGKVDGETHRVSLSSTFFTFGLRAYFSENEPTPLVSWDSPGQRRFYFGVRVGGSLLTEDRWTDEVSLDPEPSAWGAFNQTGALTLGVDLHAPWGFEVVADSLEQTVRVEGVGAVAEYGMGIVMPQVRFRYPLRDGRWVPYATAGLGIAYGEINDRKENPANLRVKAKGIHPAASIGVGLEYFFVRNLSLHSDLRWIYTWDQEIRVGDGPSRRGDFSALLLTLGFRAYLFDF